MDSLEIAQRRYEKGILASSVWERIRKIIYPSATTTIGAGMGLISLFLPWAGREPNTLVQIPPASGMWADFTLRFPYASQYGFLDLMDWNSSIKACLLIFLLGTILGFVTRLGGLLQAIGLLGFGVEFSEFIMMFRLRAMPYPTGQFEFYLSAGCVLAAVSTFVVLFAGRKRALENPACGCVPCSSRVGALAPYAARIRT